MFLERRGHDVFPPQLSFQLYSLILKHAAVCSHLKLTYSSVALHCSNKCRKRRYRIISLNIVITLRGIQTPDYDVQRWFHFQLIFGDTHNIHKINKDWLRNDRVRIFLKRTKYTSVNETITVYVLYACVEAIAGCLKPSLAQCRLIPRLHSLYVAAGQTWRSTAVR